MGGVETHCEQLYPRLKGMMLEPREIIVYARAPYVPDGVREYRGIAVEPLWAIRNAYLETITHTLFGLFHARFRRRADVVHIHAIGPGLTIPIAKLLGLKVVFTHHGEDYQRDKWNGLAKSALRFGERLAMTFSDRIIVVSRSLLDKHPQFGGRIAHIPNGAAIEAPAAGSEDVLTRYGLEPRRYVLAVARLVPEKGIHELVDAFERAPDDGAKLVVVGDAQDGGGYAEALRARAGSRVIFTGRLHRADIAPLYQHCRLFVLPSHHEGLPIAALEALSLGARVLLSGIAANREIDLQPGNYFPVGDVAALAERLAAVDAVPMADAEAIGRRYDWNTIAVQTAEVFAQLEGGSRVARHTYVADPSKSGG
jgi:glycosyltransferase involved in cell wall biosynthesis